MNFSLGGEGLGRAAPGGHPRMKKTETQIRLRTFDKEEKKSLKKF